MAIEQRFEESVSELCHVHEVMMNSYEGLADAISEIITQENRKSC